MKNEVLRFIGKSLFYALVLILLLYFYHFNHSNGVHFIYQEF
ncbi:MAG: teichoic acid D-Ala incorporation-associated protein DltX [Streptococcaceae bacterium]|jgi:hypothetical protein|nr:teichoic acid D-Ala incorporation-associated protein DltX [Streptococcaceae bacterium]